MEIQRTTLSQSAAGALLAALAKSDSSDNGAFQRQLTETIDAVKPRRENSDRQERSADDSSSVDRPAADRRRDGRVRREDQADCPSATDDVPQAADAKVSAQPSTDVEPTAGGEAPEAESEAAVTPVRDSAARSTASVDQAATEASAASVTEPSMGDAARELLKALGEVARVVVTDGNADADLQQNDLQALAALGLKLQQSTGSTLTTGGDEQAVADPTTVEFALKQVQTGDSTRAAPDEAAGMTAQRVSVRRQMQTAQAAEVAASTGDAESDDSAPAAVKGPNAVQTRSTSPSTLMAPAVQAQVATVTVTSSSSGNVGEGLGGSAESALGGIPNATAKGPTAAGTESSERTAAADQGEQIDRIARVMRASISRGGSRVNLELEPQDLGRVRIQMNLRGNDLTAKFETQTETARQFLEQGMNQLRDGLAQGGIRLIQATVENNGSQNDNLDGRGQQQGGSQANQQQGGESPHHSSQYQPGEDDAARAETFLSRDSLDVVA
jgi:flagellar hook-length control protein FliK